MKIPSKIRIGGQEVKVTLPDKIEDSKLGKCCMASGKIEIARSFDGIDQSHTSKENTFWHEVTHCILDTMGRSDLSRDETFVCCFAGFLTECYHSMEEDWNKPDNE